MTPDAVESFRLKLAASLGDGTFVRLVLSSPVDSTTSPERVVGRLVDLKRGPHVSFTARFPTQDTTENVPVAESVEWVLARAPARFRSALLATTARDWQLHFPERGDARLVGHKAAVKKAPDRAHNRAKTTHLDEHARDWLSALGILDASGRVRASMAAKHVQIHRFLELISHLAKDCGWDATTPGTELLPDRVGIADADGLSIVDMGCGKGYLTFGVWHLFERVFGRPARVLGVEARATLVDDANRLSRSIGAVNLSFATGSISTVSLDRVDALIALHACDTATDDAILRGVELGARLIVVAPCCHRELRPQISHRGALAPALEHGLLEERMAEWVTDALRTLVLEWAGYRTRVIEFVPSEHTAKNLMIAAVRIAPPFESKEARSRIDELRESFGIRHHGLDRLLERDAPCATRSNLS